LQLKTFNMFSLGIIGFMIGGELKAAIFKKYGKQFITILLAEGLITFVLVTIAVTLVARLVMPDASWQMSLAVGLLLGAISSATAPAATVDVLWEYKTKGPLTRTVLALVALDDGLALLIFGFASSAAAVLAGSSGDATMFESICRPLYEIFGAIVLGGLTSLILIFTLRYLVESDKVLALTLASVMLIIGLSHALGVDSILSAMVLGAGIANVMPRKSERTFGLIEKFAPPIYVLFFVLVGAGLNLGSMTTWVATLAGVYVVTRTVGKFAGAWIGAKMSNAHPSVRKYAGLCLFSQAGVAVGLSIVAASRFPGELGQTIILVVTATTFLVQIIGPSSVKLAVTRAGEVNRNVTSEDLIATYSVSDVMLETPVTLNESTPIDAMLKVFSSTLAMFFPVVDDQNHLLGRVTISAIKDGLSNQKMLPWALTCDLMLPVEDVFDINTPLPVVVKKLKRSDQQHFCVLDTETNTLAGTVDMQTINRKINAEILRRNEM
jgi:NhaP-type Na+/H+ or K+/H+ antiporter